MEIVALFNKYCEKVYLRLFMFYVISLLTIRCIELKYKCIAEYMSANKLVINADKTHILVMGAVNGRSTCYFSNSEISEEAGPG
jgi:hypothetical protein